MSGHSSWATVRVRLTPGDRVPVDEFMIQYCQGYIQALEDLLRFTSRVRPDPNDEVNRGLRYWDGQIQMLKDIRREAGDSLHHARRTLKLVLDRKEADDQREVKP